MELTGPVSRTSTTAEPSFVEADTRIIPPSARAWTALFNRLSRTDSMPGGSAMIIRFGGTNCSITTDCAVAAGDTLAIAAAISSPSLQGLRRDSQRQDSSKCIQDVPASVLRRDTCSSPSAAFAVERAP